MNEVYVLSHVGFDYKNHIICVCDTFEKAVAVGGKRYGWTILDVVKKSDNCWHMNSKYAFPLFVIEKYPYFSQNSVNIS